MLCPECPAITVVETPMPPPSSCIGASTFCTHTLGIAATTGERSNSTDPALWEPLEGVLCLQHQCALHNHLHTFLPNVRETSCPPSWSNASQSPGEWGSSHVCSTEYALVEAYERVRKSTGMKQRCQKQFYNRKVNGLPHKEGNKT